MGLNLVQVKTCSYCNGAGRVSAEQNTILGRGELNKFVLNVKVVDKNLKNHVQHVKEKVLKIKQLN